MTKPIIIREECLTDYLEFRLYWIEESLVRVQKEPPRLQQLRARTLNPQENR